MTSDQKTIFALFVAVLGLFLVWLWSTGRARVVWQDLWTGSTQSGFQAGGSSAPTTSPGSWWQNILQGAASGAGSSGALGSGAATDPVSAAGGAAGSAAGTAAGSAAGSTLGSGIGAGVGGDVPVAAAGDVAMLQRPAYVPVGSYAPSYSVPATSPFSFTGLTIPSAFGNGMLLTGAQ